MEVYIYVDYRQDKDTGEEQLEVPEVYATKEAAEQHTNNPGSIRKAPPTNTH